MVLKMTENIMKKAFLVMIICIAAFAQVPELLWTHDLLSHCYGSPACADIDFDGKLEIVFGTYFDDEHAYALNAEDGSLLWRFDVGGGPLDAAPVIADVDMDDSLEVIIPASWGIVYCLSGDGEVEWRYPASGYCECIDSPPAVADVDEDGRPEVIFGAWYGKVYVLDGEDGSLAWSVGLCDTGYVQSAPCILDCDDDGHLDIVVAMFRGDCTVYALSGQSSAVKWSYRADDWMYAGAATADIDLDGKPELVIGDYSGKVFALNAEDGSFIWEESIGYYVFPPVTIAELNDAYDGLEILAADYELTCLTAEGEFLWEFPTGGNIDRGAVVAEIDGDRELEVIIGSSDCYLYVLNGEDGSLVWEYLVDSTYQIENAPIVEDFDDDGWVDIFCIGGWGTSDTIPNYGRAYAIKAGHGSGEVWTMYRHDPFRTGYLNGGPTSVFETASPRPSLISLSVSPNPFNSAVKISLDFGSELSELLSTIEIFDLNGRRVAQLSGGGTVGAWHRHAPHAEEDLSMPNPYEFTWQPAPSLGSGVYLVRARAGDKEAMKRIVYLK